MCAFIGAIVVALLAIGLVLGLLTTRRFARLRETSGLSREEFNKAGAGLLKAGAFGPEAEEARLAVVNSIKLQTATFVVATLGILYIVYVCEA